MKTLEIRALLPAQTLALRTKILRPDAPVDEIHFAGDDAPDVQHFGAFVGEKLAGAVYLVPKNEPDSNDENAFQMRGMAVEPEFRGRGIASALVEKCLESARENGGKVIWCNARLVAVGVYQRAGFEIVGEQFEIENIGPHFRMRRVL